MVWVREERKWKLKGEKKEERRERELNERRWTKEVGKQFSKQRDKSGGRGAGNIIIVLNQF